MNEEKIDTMNENETVAEVVEKETVTETAKEEESVESLADNVKSLSPTQLVLKRFFRSKLSIVGLVIIVFLFLFSFLGPVFSPYGETEVDYNTDRMNSVLTEITYTIPVYDDLGNPVLDENGKVDAQKLDPILYDGVTHAYWNFGEKVGQAFSDGKKIQG